MTLFFRRNLILIGLTTAFPCLIACGPGKAEFDKLTEQNAQLKERIETLERDLDEERHGAERLLSGAQGFIRTEDLDSAKEQLTLLLKIHPDSNEANSAAVLLKDVERRLVEREQKRIADLEKKKREEQQRIKAATSRMRASYDEFQGFTWYEDKGTPALDTGINLYFGRSDNQNMTPLRFKVTYFAEDWLFVRKLTVKNDDQVTELDLGDFERDNGSGFIWETVDVKVEGTLKSTIRGILSAKTTKIRFHGDHTVDDHLVTKAERARLQAVYDAYRALGGKPGF